MSGRFARNTARHLQSVCSEADRKLLDLTPRERRRYYKSIKFLRTLAEECRLIGF